MYVYVFVCVGLVEGTCLLLPLGHQIDAGFVQSTPGLSSHRRVVRSTLGLSSHLRVCPRRVVFDAGLSSHRRVCPVTAVLSDRCILHLYLFRQDFVFSIFVQERPCANHTYLMTYDRLLGLQEIDIYVLFLFWPIIQPVTRHQ